MGLNGRRLKGLWQAPRTMEHSSPGCILNVSVGIFLMQFGTFLHIFSSKGLKVVDLDSYLKMDHYKLELGMWPSVPCVPWLCKFQCFCHFQACGKSGVFSSNFNLIYLT